MQVDIKALKAAAQKATQGPWGCFANENEVGEVDGHDVIAINSSVHIISEDHLPCDETAHYIGAMSPDVALALIDELEQLRAEKAAALDQLHKIASAKPVEQEPMEKQALIEKIARAMAFSVGWKAWDTAKDCTQTMDGSDPDDERDYWCGLAQVAISAASQEPVAAVQGKALVPEGWKLVPIKSTPKMIDATWDIMVRHVSENKRNRIIWDAMIAAAPEPK